MRLLRTVTTVVLLTASATFAEDVSLIYISKAIKARIGNDVFAVFRFDEDRRKPFALPVTAPGGFEILKSAKPSDEPGIAGRKVIIADEAPHLQEGEGLTQKTTLGEVVEIGQIKDDYLHIPAKNVWIHRSDIAPLVSTVTRLVNDNPVKVKDRKDPLYYDHPHHKGVWLSVDEINGIKFWNEDGIIKNQSVEVLQKKGNPAIFKTVNHWVDADDKPLLREETTVSVYANRLMTYDVTFTSPIREIEIGDTKEGMFAIRLPNSMRELVAGGPVTNADGAKGTKEAWGRESNWVDYKGPIDGHVFGVTLMDHPENPWKSRYHVRDYGLFSVNPFGAGAYSKGREDEQPAHHRVMQPDGEKLNFKYGLYVHGGETTQDEIEKVYQQFAGSK